MSGAVDGAEDGLARLTAEPVGAPASPLQAAHSLPSALQHGGLAGTDALGRLGGVDALCADGCAAVLSLPLAGHARACSVGAGAVEHSRGHGVAAVVGAGL